MKVGQTEIDAGMFMEYLQAQGRDRFRGDRYNSTPPFSLSPTTFTQPSKNWIFLVFVKGFGSWGFGVTRLETKLI